MPSLVKISLLDFRGNLCAAYLKHAPVAFLAELTKDVTIQNKIIQFDNVKLYIGDAYLSVHRNFIAPVNGLYQFSVTAYASLYHYIVLELTVITRVVGKVLAGDTAYDECRSKSFLLQLSSRDDVYVQHKTTGDYLMENPAARFPTFSGVYTTDSVVKNEPEYQQMLSKRLLLDENYYTLHSKIDNLTKRVDALEKENALLKHAPVAFLAELTKDVTSQNQIISFDSVKLNIGNAYFNVHGNFIAPVNGLYQFSVTACAQTHHYIVLELIVNTRVVGKVLAGDTGYNECSSNSFLLQLSTSDDVYVQHKTSGDYLLANPGAGLPTFSGVLLNVI
ncbi:unnamed protein product [Mytilus coruscus]|uniref:C1q domain-containing protein n=1 Tax=Mytilus coruscus TaxID=42192 RepID=A0A6J8DRG4_MYTCO|nr:unnamed protein product [Mytilus coruscus]